MGTLCFVILINDAMSDMSHSWKYVANSIVAVDGNTTSNDFSELQDNIDELQQWPFTSDVTINATKTVVMHVNLRPRKTTLPTIIVAPNTLQTVKTSKFLGVIIADELNLKTHITTVSKAAAYRLYRLRRLKSLGVLP